MVQMALEVDSHGEPVVRAIRELIEQRELGWLISTLKGARRSSTESKAWEQIATPEQLAAALRAEPMETEVVNALLPHLAAAAAAPVLLDALTDVTSAHARRFLLDHIVPLGFEVGPPAVERLADPRWFVKRNMLRILGDLEVLPPNLKAGDYLQDQDPRVRREALRIVLRDPGLRERAVCRALGDPDERMVWAALTAAIRSFPPAALPLVASRALAGTSPAQRVMAIRALAASGIKSAVDTLLKLTTPRKTLFGTRLPPKSTEYLAALTGLRAFAEDPRASDILQRASRSRDPEIVRAAGTQGAR
jgi:hypothetical protein